MTIDFPRSPLSLIRWVINARPPWVEPGNGKGLRIAGVLPTRNYSDDCSVFETLENLCDATIVLDDNSTSAFPFRDRCTDYVAVRNRQPWSAPANLTMLFYRAWLLGCEWIVAMDDDIMPAATFTARGDVEDVIRFMGERKLDVCRFRLRDLWDSLGEVRVDGVWSRKTFPVVYRNWFFYPGLAFKDPKLRLHTAAFPSSLRLRSVVHERHRVYHTGCITRSKREARVAKYRKEDPDNRFQSDYGYMLDDAGLELESVPEDDADVIRKKCRIDV